MSFPEILADLRTTNVTKTIHSSPYEAISPLRPELSQAGKSILITGGGTAVGFAMAKSFIKASAATVIILGRRADVLDTARIELEKEAKSLGTGTKIIARPCDAVNTADVDALWKDLSDQNIFVDVYVNNAAKFTEPVTMMDLGFNELWSYFEINTKSPMYFASKFCAQPGDKQKERHPLLAFILNVTTANIHATQHPIVSALPAYTLSKFAGTVFFQYLAQDYSHDKVQVISFHPGLLYNDYFKEMGIDSKHFDDKQLTGSFAVWAASKEAAFLHGRTVWASWDVDELATGKLRKRIDEDFYFLRGTVAGLNAGNLA
ncbi:putative short-chain dehydrogenase [Paraphoma chrysanthemicola]|uniref:Short-chain dehydrogenase n=1 Tax=Paraphoma chrysanthemicola TaxID=798071 RepID=A0A8K0VZ75_9PLEO|nr:putative short-chain dehydrogenase [Paraphoma chrysanthemicola]